MWIRRRSGCWEQPILLFPKLLFKCRIAGNFGVHTKSFNHKDADFSLAEYYFVDKMQPNVCGSHIYFAQCCTPVEKRTPRVYVQF